MGVLEDFAVKSLNLTDVELAEIVYSDAEKTTVKETALQELLNRDAERVKSLKSASKEELTKMHDKGHQKGLAEGLGKFEQSLKEQFGVADSTAQGIELVKEILAKQGKNTNIDDEAIKLTPLYRKLETALQNDYIAKSEYDKVKGEFDGYKSQVEKEKVLTVVLSDGLRAFRELKPVLPKDPAKALNQETDFLNKLKGFEYEVQADGSHIIKIDGKRLENAQGHPVQFKDFIKQQAEKYYEFEVQGDKGNAGNQGGNGSGSFKVPTNEREYQVALATATSGEERIKIKKAWEESHK